MVAMAASAALPPRFRMLSPASLASGCAADTTALNGPAPALLAACMGPLSASFGMGWATAAVARKEAAIKSVVFMGRAP